MHSWRHYFWSIFEKRAKKSQKKPDFKNSLKKYASSQLDQIFTGGVYGLKEWINMVKSGTHLLGGPFRPQKPPKSVCRMRQTAFWLFLGPKGSP